MFTIRGFRYGIPNIVQFLERYFRQVGSLFKTATFCKIQKLQLVQNADVWADQYMLHLSSTSCSISLLLVSIKNAGNYL